MGVGEVHGWKKKRGSSEEKKKKKKKREERGEVISQQKMVSFLFFYFFLLFFFFLCYEIMQSIHKCLVEAICTDNENEVERILTENELIDWSIGWPTYSSPLIEACSETKSVKILSLLLNHPSVDVNFKDVYGDRAIILACLGGKDDFVAILVEDPRVELNVTDANGVSLLKWLVRQERLDYIKLWISSGKEMVLRPPGGLGNDVIGHARKKKKVEFENLLVEFRDRPEDTRHKIRLELGWYERTGWYEKMAASFYAQSIFLCDGLVQIRTNADEDTTRFFTIISKLPLELQMTLCLRAAGSMKSLVSGKDSEWAFRELVKFLLS